jgi:hypothetical protein
MHEKKLVAKFSHAEIVSSTLQIFLKLFKLKSSGLEKIINLRLIKRLFKSNICLTSPLNLKSHYGIQR